MASPELDVVLAMLRARPADAGASLEELRARLEALAAAIPVVEGTQVLDLEAAGVPCERIVPADGGGAGVLLYLHGGGFALGSLVTHRALAARLAAACGTVALSVGYRLAPEHPFPAALDDALAVYRWLLRSGIAPQRIVVGGDSAGGGLVIAALVALRAAGDPLPVAAICLSPWVDLEGRGRSLITNAGCDPMVHREGLLQLAAAYLGGADPRTPLAGPLHADLSRLPPLLVHVGTREALLDDGVRLAARARAAGVDVVLERWQEMIHVWHAFAPLLPEACEAIERVGDFVRTHLRTAHAPTRHASWKRRERAGAAGPARPG